MMFDLNLSGMDGLELCKVFRRQAATESVPIVILTARSSELDRVLAFEFGANDYIMKPFCAREVVLHVGKQLRQTQPIEAREEVFQLREILLDLARRTVKVA